MGRGREGGGEGREGKGKGLEGSPISYWHRAPRRVNPALRGDHSNISINRTDSVLNESWSIV